MGPEWRYYAGTRYLYVDYKGCKDEQECLAVYEAQAKMMRSSPVKTRVLSDFTGVYIGSDFMKRVNEGGKEHGAALLERTAMLGVTGLKRIIADGYRTVTGLSDKVRIFDDEEQALAWLVE